MTTTTPQATLVLRNVLFATDFSAVAHHYGSTQHLAHVVQPVLFSIIPPEGYVGTVEAEAVVMERARADVQKLVAGLWDVELAERGGFEPPVQVLARTTV